MEHRLNEIYKNINNWLKYAEAKNGVLISLNGVALFGVLSYLEDVPKPAYDSLTWVLIPSFVISIIVLLVSFFPITNKYFKKSYDLSKSNIKDFNLIYNDDIRKLDPEIYLRYLYESVTGNTKEVFTKYELDISQQIINNAEISYRKYLFFRISCFIDLLGIFVGLLIFLCRTFS
jgi:hypothetical protein